MNSLEFFGKYGASHILWLANNPEIPDKLSYLTFRSYRGYSIYLMEINGCLEVFRVNISIRYTDLNLVAGTDRIFQSIIKHSAGSVSRPIFDFVFALKLKSLSHRRRRLMLIP